MGSNSFGTLFRVTTWGESHGRAIGALIDGCPAGLHLNEEMINEDLKKRAPGNSPYTSPRKEADLVEIWSGVFEGMSTGAPISLIILNTNGDSSAYEPIKHLLRPGHANYTYIEKYGLFDYRGGGRASARETVARVAAGSVAKALLRHFSIEVSAYLEDTNDLALAIEEGDSVGGVVAFTTSKLPVGLGDPVYEKLEANLAKAMMGLPASKGFEMGLGFKASTMRGSEYNDPFTLDEGSITMKSNHAGGTLGGISSGMPLFGRVAFKPTSSIRQPVETVTVKGDKATLQMPSHSRHDPCVAIRAVPVVEAMLALTLADALLMQRLNRL